MLPILRPRTILYTSRFLRTRLFTTVPRKIPPHIKRWDPTLYAPNRSQEAQAVSAVDCRDQELLYRSERERLRDTQRVEVLAKSNQDNATHNFNQLLLLSNQRSNRDPELWKPLWGAYTHGKRNVGGFLYLMTARAWDIMWITQNAYARHSQSLRRLRELYRDMDSFWENPTVGERVQSLEGLYGKGMKEQALKEWQDDRNNHDGLRHDYKPEHLEVGVRLHALAGNLDYAQSIMEELFDLYPSWDPSIMMTVFRAHTSRKLGQDHHVAKELYMKMKSTMGMNSSLEHYDSWFVGFLEVGHIQHAKLVLTDMVKDGKIAHSYSTEHVHEVLKRLHLLYRLGTDISKMTSIALHAITVLPKPYHSHVFGDWMKNTVVQKAPEAAAQILDMMFHRGYKPETYHFNMLLRALFRTKEKPHILKAENIGWRMIDEARKLSLPKHKSTPRTISEAVGENAKLADDVDNTETKPNVPPADASTFTLIMRYHGEKLQWEHVDYLSRQLKQSNVRPNAPLMNIIIDNLCRQGKYREAWKVYESFTRPSEGTQGVFPNGASFRQLWKTLRLALGDKATRDDPKLPSPRALLAETVRWWTMCQSRFDADRFLQGLSAASRRAIQGLIMHCFSYTQDLPGSLVALHVLSKNFGIFPDSDAVEVLQKHIAWIDMGAESRSVGSQHHHHISRLNNQNIERMKRVYDILTEGRLNRMNLTKDQYAQMNFEEAKEIRLNLLSEFVRVTLKRHSSPQQVEAMIDAAKLSVGVPDMCTGDLDAFAVS